MGSANDDLARFYAVGDVPAERARDTPDDVSGSSAISSNGTVYVGGANERLYAVKPWPAQCFTPLGARPRLDAGPRFGHLAQRHAPA